MQKMPRSDEDRLVRCVESVIDSTNNGLDPTAALQKVAAAENLSPEHTRRVGEAYNQSRTMHELTKRAGDEKLGVFPTVDIDAAVNSLFPKMYKNAGHVALESKARKIVSSPTPDLYEKIAAATAKGQMQKQASPLKGPSAAVLTLQSKHLMAKEAAAIADVKQASYTHEAAINEVGEMARQAFAQGVSFVTLEKYAHANWDADFAKAGMDLLWFLSNAEKLGQKRASPQDIDSSHYTLSDFQRNKDTFASVERLFGTAMNLQKRAAGLGVTIGPKAVPAELQKIASDSAVVPSTWEGQWEKASFLGLMASPLTGTYSAAQSGLDSIKNQGDKKYKEEVERGIQKLEEPGFRDEMSQIQTQAMLHDLMTNDDVISGYDPQEVIDAFNSVGEVAPEAAKNTAVMRDLIRRHLVQGGLEGMEIGQAAQLNKTIADTSTLYNRGDRMKSLLTDAKSLAQQNKGVNKDPFGSGAKK